MQKKSQANFKFSAFSLAFSVIFLFIVFFSNTLNIDTWGEEEAGIFAMNSPASNDVFLSPIIPVNITIFNKTQAYIYISIFQNSTVINLTTVRLNQTILFGINVPAAGAYNITATLYDSKNISHSCTAENVSVIEYPDDSVNETNETLIEFPGIYFFFAESPLFAGEMLSLLAWLGYANNTPAPNTTITYIIENNTILGMNYTNETGWSALFINTTGMPVGNHTINATSVYGTSNSTTIEIILLQNITNSSAENATVSNSNETAEENMTMPESQTNETIEKATAELPLLINETVLQGKAMLGQPVKWTKEVTLENPNNNSKEANLSISVPESVSRITVQEEKKQVSGFSVAATATAKEVFSNKYSISERFEGKQTKKYTLFYETPAPQKHETPTDRGKRIVVYSDVSFHYHNITAFTDIPDLNYKPRVYRVVEGERIDVTGNSIYSVSYLDTDSDNLYDRIEWIVPQLSNDTYEIDLTVLNVQSYPIVGGNWTVMFETSGTADLVISAVNGTSFGTNLPDDLEFLDLKCGNDSLKKGLIFIDREGNNHTYYELYATRDEIAARIAELNETINGLRESE